MGYVNPDATTVAYLRGRRFAPGQSDFDGAAKRWMAFRSEPDAAYADTVTFTAEDVAPTVTWGTHPGQSVAVDERLPDPRSLAESEQAGVRDALAYMKFRAGEAMAGQRVDVAFVGSCTNGRLSDIREAAAVVRGRRVAPHVRAIVVPGSQQVRAAAEAEGIHEVFQEAGFEWRAAGCSMCLAMNPDRLEGDQLCASSSNRNFKGRQGSPTGRTLLMSPAMVAAAAVAGEVVDVRSLVSSTGGY